MKISRLFICLTIAGSVTLGSIFLFPVIIAVPEVYFSAKDIDPANWHARKQLIFSGYVVFVFLIAFLVTNKMWEK